MECKLGGFTTYDRWEEVLERLSRNEEEVKKHEKPGELKVSYWTAQTIYDDLPSPLQRAWLRPTC